MRGLLKGAVLFVLALILAMMPFERAFARIKLVALPERERVEVQLDNGRYTLVEEERVVPLLASNEKRGNNMIDFSWSNTRINKDSIQFRPIAIRDGDKFREIKKTEHGYEVNVINVSYPPGENALVWEVYSASSCAVKVRVSYIIANLNRHFSYRALADNKEQVLRLEKHLNITNFSGEDFGESSLWAGFGNRHFKLLGNQQIMRILHSTFVEVPIAKTYTVDWYKNGRLNDDKPFASKIEMHYEIANTAEKRLGEFPLQPGKVRIFIEDGRGGEAFLGEDWAALTPIDDKMRLYLGEARDVVCERTIEKNERRREQGNLFHQEIVIKYEIENFKDEEVVLCIREQMNRVAREYFGHRYSGTSGGDVEWEKGRGTSKEIEIDMEDGIANPKLMIRLPARKEGEEVEKTVVRFHFTLKNLWQ